MRAVSLGGRGGAFQIAAGHRWGDVVLEQEPGGVGPLFVVERTFAAGYLAPSGEAFGNRFDQDDLALVGASEAGLEEVHQGQTDVVQVQAINSGCHFANR